MSSIAGTESAIARNAPSSKCILSIPFSKLRNKILEMDSVATPCTHRLLDMRSFIESRRLDIYEYPSSLTCDFYTAVSYVWKGNKMINDHDPSSPCYWTEELGTFNVKGAENGDPISLDVLYHVCHAALSRSYSGTHLWLDRLCILQASEEDKAWQIRRMHDIYKHCRLCCILPGGVQRLVGLDEETPWIDRAWTLQEALLPHNAIVMFLDDEELLEKFFDGKLPYYITQVVPSVSAYSQLRPLLEDAIKFTSHGVKISILGAKRAPIISLYGASTKQNTRSFIEKDMKMQMIWQCAMMRTSSHPVDMVFSIMGLLSVDLDPLQFNKNDRLKATIALARESLFYIGNAAWLTSAYQLEPCRQLSSFPIFPKTSVGGQAYYDNLDLPHAHRSSTLVADVVEETCHFNHWLLGLPKGTMDEDGYLEFSSMAVDLVPVTAEIPVPVGAQKSGLDRLPSQQQHIFHAENGSQWQVLDAAWPEGKRPSPRTIAILLGTRQDILSNFLGPDRADSGEDDVSLTWRQRFNTEYIRKHQTDVALIIQEHSQGRFHRVSYLKAKGGFDAAFENLTKTTVLLGGPNTQ